MLGLRQTMNRLASIVIPPLMGAIADLRSATASFVILGAALSLLCIPIARFTRRNARSAIVEEAPEPT